MGALYLTERSKQAPHAGYEWKLLDSPVGTMMTTRSDDGYAKHDYQLLQMHKRGIRNLILCRGTYSLPLQPFQSEKAFTMT